ncbi:hypothetical protein SAMN04488564_101441 [Lentzea waywayandensis]|uniref:Mg2+ and Co2+ transporter CorA n=1 Tax=Lentzea waywayandensis TaxID=84724 RepID=A0A1I6CW25_9PSEU|nr:hypothetical protein SAMN04488564_101441 [Lentzea waywayandensis]
MLAGDPADPNLGARVTVSVGVEGLAGFCVPFVRVTAGKSRRILVGEVRTDGAQIDVLVRAAWSEHGGWHQEPWHGDGIAELLRHPAHAVGDGSPRAGVIAKAIAEGSRNAIAELRGLRYEMEQRVADLLAQRENTVLLRPVMAQLVELSMAFSRARDHARDTIREVRDPGVVRHCEAMDVELGDEVTRLQSLLTSVSTFAVAQEGEAQQRFNMVAAAAAAGLGLPAVILSLYGADDYLPFTWESAWRALVPIIAAVTVAAGVILNRMPGRTGAKHYLTALGLITGLIGVLLLAGFLAPG